MIPKEAESAERSAGKRIRRWIWWAKRDAIYEDQ